MLISDFLYVQFNVCTSKNKNSIVVAYFESLVARKVFSNIEALFLHVKHIHEGTAQELSRTFKRLRSTEAISLADLHEELSKTFNERARVVHMKSVANWTGLWEQEYVFRPVSAFSQFWHFRFQRSGYDEIRRRWCKVSCTVKINPGDSWTELKSSSTSACSSFPMNILDLQKTPPTNITLPKYRNEATKRFESLESRVNCAKKMKDSYYLGNYLYRYRKDPFRWDLSGSVKLQRQRVSKDEDSSWIPSNGNEDKQPSEFVEVRSDGDFDKLFDFEKGFAYDVAFFVAVKADRSPGSSTIWAGNITYTKQDPVGTVVTIVVYWSECRTATKWTS